MEKRRKDPVHELVKDTYKVQRLVTTVADHKKINVLSKGPLSEGETCG